MDNLNPHRQNVPGFVLDDHQARLQQQFQQHAQRALQAAQEQLMGFQALGPAQNNARVIQVHPMAMQFREHDYLHLNRGPFWPIPEQVAAPIARRPSEEMEIESGSSLLSSSASSSSDDPMVIECEISEELSAQVFENDMLREMILNHIIFVHNKVYRTEVKNLRLVRKSWLRTVADTLRKCRFPMFILNANNNNSVDVYPYVEGPSTALLGNFVQAMTAPSRLPDFIPPFSLQLTPDFFRKENYQHLSECLISCGSGLIELDLQFPVNSSMTFVFHSFYLPQLQRLAVQFSDQRLLNLSGPVIHNNGHTIYPLQTILNGTDELKELAFKYTLSESFIPVGFEYLALPETITRLYLDCPLKNSDMELLIKNDLPVLSSLRLFATNVPYSDELIFRILDKFRLTLCTLSLRGHQYAGRVRNTTLFRFPVMEKLNAITVTSQCWEFEEDLSHIERQLPKLNELRMLNTRDNMFTKWTENSKYDGVKRLFVSLINVNVATYHPHNAEVPMTLTLEKMQSIHLTFPNVTSLEITVWGPQTCGLKYLFMEMKALEKLAVTVKGTSDHFHPVHWDSLLIGVPPDMVMSFRKNPEYWKMVDLKDDNDFPSIRKLSVLKSLALVETLCPGGNSDMPLISDLTFHFAFLRMPSLKHLLLHGKFSPSVQMKERWKQEKGAEIHGIRR